MPLDEKGFDVEEVVNFADGLVTKFGLDIVSGTNKTYAGGWLAIFNPKTKAEHVKYIGLLSSAPKQATLLALSDFMVEVPNERGPLYRSEYDGEKPGEFVWVAGIELKDDWYMAMTGFPPTWAQVFCMIVASHCGKLSKQERNTMFVNSRNEALLRSRYMWADRETEDILAVQAMTGA